MKYGWLEYGNGHLAKKGTEEEQGSLEITQYNRLYKVNTCAKKTGRTEANGSLGARETAWCNPNRKNTS